MITWKIENLRSAVTFVILMFIFSGCSGDLFEVENPNNVLAEDLNSPEFIHILGNSAEGALSQHYSFWLIVAGMPSDEVIAQQTSQNGDRFIDIGVFDGVYPFVEDAYDNLAAARWAATNVTERLSKLVEDSTTSIEVAKSCFWDGIARTTLADMFKEIPFDNGPAHTPIEVYEGAIELFEKAAKIAKASNTDIGTEYEAAAYASAARVYRSLYFERKYEKDAFVQAEKYALMALQVDPRFSLEMVYQAPGIQNEAFINLNQGSYYNMGPSFGHMIDPVSNSPDPRVKHSDLIGHSNLRGDELFNQLKYPDGNSDVPISRWQEAELIIAEYDALIGNPADAIIHINNVRKVAGLPDFMSTDSAAIEDQIKYERKAEFWLELRRWQDMRYYNIIPDVWIPASKDKGIDRRFPISLREKDANPNV